MWEWKTDSNFCPYLLSPTASASRTKCLGTQVSRFARPFELRPADPVRREVYRQLAATIGIASTSGWVAPSTTLPVTPPPLGKGTEESASKVVPPNPRARARGRDPHKHSAAEDVPKGEN